MTDNKPVKINGINILLDCLAAVLASAIAVFIIMNLWKADLSVPFAYERDAVQVSASIKGMTESGSFFILKNAGAPGISDTRCYPCSDGLHIIVLKVISLFTSNWAVILNLFYLLSFFFASASTMFVFRRLGLSFAISLAGSLLFALLPYHFIRGETHLFLSAYFAVPLSFLLAIEIFEKKETKGSGYIFDAILCAVIASTGIYYTFFSCFIILIAGIVSYLRSHKSIKLKKMLGLEILLVVFVVVNMLPFIAYNIKGAETRVAVLRSPVAVETYGLKIIQLILPVTGHRLGQIAEVKDVYNAKAPLVNENDSASLGLVVSIGFLILIAFIFVQPGSRLPDNRLKNLSILNISCILLAVVGGFGAVFSGLLFPALRAYNRISIFIGFMSVLALMLSIESLAIKKKIDKKPLFLILIATGCFFALYDYSSARFIPEYSGLRKAFSEDAGFISGIESKIDQGSAVFQLPFIEFPENPPVYGMKDYEQMKMYLHSKYLRWSYGALRGSPVSERNKEISEMPVSKMVDELKKAGFAGITVNRDGYEDKGLRIEKELSKILGVFSLEHNSKKIVFYSFGKK